MFLCYFLWFHVIFLNFMPIPRILCFQKILYHLGGLQAFNLLLLEYLLNITLIFKFESNWRVTKLFVTLQMCGTLCVQSSHFRTDKPAIIRPCLIEQVTRHQVVQFKPQPYQAFEKQGNERTVSKVIIKKGEAIFKRWGDTKTVNYATIETKAYPSKYLRKDCACSLLSMRKNCGRIEGEIDRKVKVG